MPKVTEPKASNAVQDTSASAQATPAKRQLAGDYESQRRQLSPSMQSYQGGLDLSNLHAQLAAEEAAAGGKPSAKEAAPAKIAPMLTPQEIVQNAFTLGGQSRYQVGAAEAMAWIESNMGNAPPEQRLAWMRARDQVNKRL